jgi:ionotropic glutamate receptor
MNGVMFELFKLIQKELGFDYVFVPSSDGKYGSSNEIGQWNGLIGLLSRNELDLCITDLTITSARDRV